MALKILTTAILYIKLGWAVLPIPEKSKAPSLKNWTELRITVEEAPEYFTEGMNIGVIVGEASKGLGDVDLDCDEAIALAGDFLPPTGLCHGRESRPRSHWWYVTEPVPQHAAYDDIDGSRLVELRSTGHQTVVPPSIHPSGEQIVWHDEREPAKVSPEVLETAVRRLAACTLVARHWPEKGSRNKAALALTGALLRIGWSPSETERFVSAAARTAGDEEWQQRGNCATSTERRLVEERNATGWPTLCEILGPPTVERLKNWLDAKSTASSVKRGVEARRWPEPISKDAYHGVIGDIVSAMAPHSEADEAALLIQALVAAGNVIGRQAYFQVEADKHYANFFIVVVGVSAKGRKGVSWGQIRNLFASVDPTWGQRLASGLSSGEGLIWAVRDPIKKQVAVKEKGKIVGYQTEIVDHGVSDKRLLVIEPEFASVLNAMQREGNKLSALIRQAWETGDLQSLTKNSPAVATGACISIVGHTTKSDLLKYLDSTEMANGFANRFLWVMARRSKVLPEGGKLHEVDFKPIIERLAQVRDFLGVEEVDLVDHRVKWCKDALAEWCNIYPRLSEGTPGMLGAITGRAEAQVTRLATLYALLDLTLEIRVEHLHAALAVWKYCEDSARFIFGSSLGDPNADALLRAIRDSGVGMSRTQINEFFGHKKQASEIDRVLIVLSEMGLIKMEKRDTGGRPEERWIPV
jgi:hypothetical protein